MEKWNKISKVKVKIFFLIIKVIEQDFKWSGRGFIACISLAPGWSAESGRKGAEGTQLDSWSVGAGGWCTGDVVWPPLSPSSIL